ncbi:cell division protein FtsX [Plastorhodobacter daqingensis]|uniref:Cell division protein FtsX n=1 Tax=Plastorhodobacter daqingensis TaxID=1387281 RepID=A0ABW2UE31_9RHOB
MSRLFQLLQMGASPADRIVPPTGYTARLTTFTAAAMAFLAVFAMALSLASGRLADRWETALAKSATIRLAAPEDQLAAQTAAVLEVLRTTPGVTQARIIPPEEQRALLEPWFGPDLPVETLPLPQLIEVLGETYDTEGLRLRLAAEAPGAIFDDHTRWRRPLVSAANRLRLLGAAAILLIAGSVAAMITLAAGAALSANAQVIRVLRLVGARDAFIAQAFVRRFTLRALGGAALGTALGMLGIFLLPAADEAGGFLTGLGFQGWHWLWPLAIPLLSAVAGYLATRAAAQRALRELQ